MHGTFCGRTQNSGTLTGFIFEFAIKLSLKRSRKEKL